MRWVLVQLYLTGAHSWRAESTFDWGAWQTRRWPVEVRPRRLQLMTAPACWSSQCLQILSLMWVNPPTLTVTGHVAEKPASAFHCFQVPSTMQSVPSQERPSVADLEAFEHTLESSGLPCGILALHQHPCGFLPSSPSRWPALRVQSHWTKGPRNQ